MFKLLDRPYQTEAVGSIWSYFATGAGGNPVIVMPTGTGKSVVIARFLQSVFARFPNQKVLILTHVKELIQQNYEKLIGLWNFAPAGIFSAGLNQRTFNKSIIFAGIQSVAKKWALFGHVDLVLIDEAHLVSPAEATMYQSFINGLLSINHHLKVIGLTATPWRLGHGHITDPTVKMKAGEEVEEPSLFTDVCFDISSMEAFNRLIAEGYLIPPVPKRTQTELNVDGVGKRGQEFIEKELQTAVDKAELTEAALLEARELAYDRKKWLIFASGTEHADHIEAMLNAMGIPAGCVHSKREGRDSTIEAFKAGKLRALVNNNVLTTGFDDPGIDCIIILRPTMSSVLWVQMLGRGTRPLWGLDGKGMLPDGSLADLNTIDGRLAAIAASGKLDCLVLDYARNTRRLGPINDPVIPRRKGMKGGEAPVKECPKCGNDVHASLRFCNALLHDGKKCNHEFVFESKLKMSAASDELIKGDLPVVKVFKVDHITYGIHKKLGANDMVKVSYYAKHHKYDEYISPENSFARKHAVRWWRERDGGDLPATTAEAYAMLDQLKQPTHIRVWTNKRYPEIMAYCYDGSEFGLQEANGERPDVEVKRAATPSPAMADLDDDIPF